MRYAKTKICWHGDLEAEKTLTPKLSRVTDMIANAAELPSATLDMKNFDRDVKLIKELYARGWER